MPRVDLKILPMGLALLSMLLQSCSEFKKENMKLELVGKTFTPNPEKLTEYQDLFDKGGSTSVRNNGPEVLKWKLQGYYQRNRDLGQTFIPKEDFTLGSLVLRTGPSDKAVLQGMPGCKVFIQFFEVIGSAQINNNNTPPGTASTHGFSQNHRTDDFIDGVRFKSMPFIYEGKFPANIMATWKDGKPNGSEGKLQYIRWTFENPPAFKKGKKYAFMVGITVPGTELGFTLANHNLASLEDEPTLEKNPYKGGWSLRREGSGKTPPVMFPSEDPPLDNPELHQRLLNESLFPAGNERYRLSPTSNGYPDVDTYRALEFYMEKADCD